jgi:hypothetical protein
MLGFVIVLVVAILALALIVLYVVRQQVQHNQHAERIVEDNRTPALQYVVPTGQDPAVILAELERGGYTATVDPSGAAQVVSIACPAGVERERARVRSLISAADVTTPNEGVPVDVDVRFRDET